MALPRSRAPIPAEHLIYGLDAPVVLVPARVATWLMSKGGLDEYHRNHRGDDAEVDQVLVAMKLAAICWRQRCVGTDCGTQAADTPRQATPSPQWLNTTAAGRALGITARAAVKAIAAGRLPAVWSAGRWWIDPEDVEHYRARRATV